MKVQVGFGQYMKYRFRLSIHCGAEFGLRTIGFPFRSLAVEGSWGMYHIWSPLYGQITVQSWVVSK